MIESLDKAIQDIRFAIIEIKKISEQRLFTNAILRCNFYMVELENVKSEEQIYLIDHLKEQLKKQIDDLRFVIQTERRFVLFPLPEIKKEAFEIGKKYMSNFLEWMNPDLTAEQIMSIIEDELFRLEEIEELLFKLFSDK